MKSVLQTELWAKFKEQAGWRVQKHDDFLSLSRSLVLGKAMTYFPELPFTDSTLKLIDDYKQGHLASGKIFTRFEFLDFWQPDSASALLKKGLVKAFEDVQPEYRQWIDLSLTEEKILEQMKSKGRYNLKIAEKNGLKTTVSTDAADVSKFYKLYAHTAARTDFSGRNEQYFQKLVEVLKAKDDLVEVVVVSKDGEPLAGAIVTYYDGLCSYLYGGSGGDRTVMAPYLMHWEIMKRAKDRGCKIYDLLAVAPEEATENHPYAGISRFKRQFGGETVRLLGSWDLVHSRFWYTLYRFAERLRRKK